MPAEPRLEPRRFADLHDVLEPRLFQEVMDLAERARGLRVLQINSTARGGGVAELLQSTVPLLRDLGLEAHWWVMDAREGFFEVTKRIHDAVQGRQEFPTPDEWRLYEETNRDLAASVDPSEWDLVVVHDPQPAAVRSLVGPRDSPRWVWRCHIDSSRPNRQVRARLSNYLGDYDAAVFTLEQYFIDGFRRPKVAIAPGIDPVAPKNLPMRPEEARRIVETFGPRLDRPLATQVGRFDRWKDPVGVIEAWRQARKDVPGLQLALVGQAAADDPGGTEVLREVHAAAARHPDVHLVVDRADDVAVNAFQTASSVVLQKSTREGFGLTVSEALWSGTPVIGGEVGGIPLQIEHGRSGFLVRSPQEAARYLVELANDAPHRSAMGRVGREAVRRRFLLPRMIRDDLELWLGLTGAPAAGRPGPGRRNARGTVGRLGRAKRPPRR